MPVATLKGVLKVTEGFKRTVSRNWVTDSGRELIRIESDGAIKITPASVNQNELRILGLACLDAANYLDEQETRALETPPVVKDEKGVRDETENKTLG
jgi:hypothetical protein